MTPHGVARCSLQDVHKRVAAHSRRVDDSEEAVKGTTVAIPHVPSLFDSHLAFRWGEAPPRKVARHRCGDGEISHRASRATTKSLHLTAHGFTCQSHGGACCSIKLFDYVVDLYFG